MSLTPGSVRRSELGLRDHVTWAAAMVLVTAAVGLWPSSAEAAVVSVRPSSKPVFFAPLELAYVAAPGERNRVVVQSGYIGSPWTVRDPGAVIQAGESCTALDAHTASCLPPASDDPFGRQLVLASVEVGDLDDEVVMAQPDAGGRFQLFADGGAGNDTLTAAEGGGEVHGGLGDDRLLSRTTPGNTALLDGGGGRDELRGGGGNETLSDGDVDGATGGLAPGTDLLDGGGGRDEVTYRRRTAPVLVDLREARGGERGERDAIRNVETVVGGRADDRLAGDDGSNYIYGRQGRDTLIGRGDTDFLFNGGRSASCGAGDDYVVNPRPREYVKPGCEAVYTAHGPSYPAYPPRVGQRALRYIVQCPRDEEESFLLPCAGRLTLRQAAAPHRLLAAGGSPTGRWESRPFRVPITPAGRRLGSARHGVLATTTLRIDDDPLMRWVIRFELPR